MNLKLPRLPQLTPGIGAVAMGFAAVVLFSACTAHTPPGGEKRQEPQRPSRSPVSTVRESVYVAPEPAPAVATQAPAPICVPKRATPYSPAVACPPPRQATDAPSSYPAPASRDQVRDLEDYRDSANDLSYEVDDLWRDVDRDSTFYNELDDLYHELEDVDSADDYEDLVWEFEEIGDRIADGDD